MKSCEGIQAEYTKSEETGGSIFITTPHRFYQHGDNEEEIVVVPGCLLKEVNTCGRHSTNRNITKTVSCSFCPYDDNLLIITGLIRDTNSGFIQMWDLEGEFDTPLPASSRYFTYSALPAGQFSKNGELFSSIYNNGTCSLTVLAVDEENELSPFELKCKGNHFFGGRVKCCVFTQDAKKVVTLSKTSKMSITNHIIDVNVIGIWKITGSSQLSMWNLWQKGCETLCPEFTGDVYSWDLSPNDNYLAISSTNGHSIILDCNTFEIIKITNNNIAESHNNTGQHLICVFHPQFSCKLLFCHFNTWCCFHNLEPNTKEICNFIENDENVSANACTFSLDGELLAIALSNATVVLCDGDLLQPMFQLKPEFNDPPAELGAFSVAISHSCQEIAVCYSQGCVRVYQLPPRLNLKHMCRLVILNFIPPKHIKLLPLPWKLKLYLLYTYSN